MSNEHSYERLCDYYRDKQLERELKQSMLKELVNFQNALFHLMYEKTSATQMLMHGKQTAHPNDARLLYYIFTPTYLFKQ